MNTDHLRHFWRSNWLLLSVFLAALLALVWFLIHMLLSFIYMNDPRHVDVELKGWMTPRYIVMTYDLPRPLVLEHLGLSNIEMHGRPLRRIGQDLGLSMDEMTDLVRTLAAQYREDQQ